MVDKPWYNPFRFSNDGMDPQRILQIFQIVTAALLVSSILLQQRGAGLGSAFGGEGNVFRARRGVERILFVSTIVFALAFFTSAIGSLFLARG